MVINEQWAVVDTTPNSNAPNGHIISYPQGRMGDRTKQLIFSTEDKAREAKKAAERWTSEMTLAIAKITTTLIE
jgi:hypothetical protein